MSLSGVDDLIENNQKADVLIRILPWVDDGITSFERGAVQALVYLALDKPFFFFDLRTHPFLQTFDNNEDQAIRLLANLPPGFLAQRSAREKIDDEAIEEVIATNSLVALGFLSGLDDMRLYMLGLINDDRRRANLDLVALGHNSAAQSHAEEMREHNYLSHWNLQGYTSYMRSTMVGEEDYALENGSNSILNTAGNYRRLDDIAEELDKVYAGFMRSEGHRKNILNPLHKKVSLGIACDNYACAVVQLFEGDYVEFFQKPNIDNRGTLSFSGRFKDGYSFTGSSSVQLWYEPLPKPTTLGQLDKTSAQSIGVEPATFIIDSPPAGSYYSSLTAQYSWISHSRPWAFAPDSPRTLVPPASPFAPRMPRLRLPGMLNLKSVSYTVADRWSGSSNGEFLLEADVSDSVRKFDNGVYTLLVWGVKDGEQELLIQYAIFYDR